METQSPARPNSAVGKLVVVWLIVAVPALWGVSQTVIKSLALFQTHTTTATTQPATQP